jgi:Flp pilus assembly pilin Flp
MQPRLPTPLLAPYPERASVTPVEYGLLVALLSVVMVVALNTLGPAIQAVLTTAARAMN